MVKRGEIWWADLPEPIASGPGYRRPVLIVQSDFLNNSKINTVIVVALTTNLTLAMAPGNVRLPSRATRLNKASVVNTSQMLTLDKSLLIEKIVMLHESYLDEVIEGIRLILAI